MFQVKISVIVLAVDETESLKKVVKKIESFQFVEKIIIVSPSFATKDCRKMQNYLKKKNSKILTLIQPKKFPGYGGAVKFSMKYINSKYFCWVDADGETNPKSLSKMYRKLKNNNDIVSASRFKTDVIFIKNYGYFSSFLTYIFQILCRIVFNKKITDYTVGYRIYKTEFFKKFNFVSNDQNFSLESLLIPIVYGEPKIEEIYYQWTKRKEGSSRNNFINKLSYFKIFFKALLIKLKI